MTEQITVDEAVTNIEAQIAQVEQERAGETERYLHKRTRMVEQAHMLGNRHGIGEALDDLLDEFGLDRRPWRGTLRMNGLISLPVGQDRVSIFGSDGQVLYTNRNFRLVQDLQGLSWTVSVREGDTCLCDQAHQQVSDWVRQAYSEGHVQSTLSKVMLAQTHCDHEDCPNEQIDWYGTPIVPRTGWLPILPRVNRPD